MFSVWYIFDCNCCLAQLDSHFPADSLYKFYQVFITNFFLFMFLSHADNMFTFHGLSNRMHFFGCIPRIKSMHLGPTEMLWEFPGRFWWKTLAVCSSKHILQDLKKKHTIKLRKCNLLDNCLEIIIVLLFKSNLLNQPTRIIHNMIQPSGSCMDFP